MGRHITRSLATAVIAGGLIAATVAVAPPGPGGPPQGGNGGQGKSGQGGTTSQGPRGGAAKRPDCRAPGKDLVNGASVATPATISIEGSGRVTLDGSVMAWTTLRGTTVRVTDRRGDAIVKLGEACQRMQPGAGGARTVTVRAPGGRRVLIDGTSVRIEVSSPGRLAVSVTGSGTGVLDGVGTFTVNNGEPKSWPLKPIDLALAPTG